MLGLIWIAALIVGLVADWNMFSNWLDHDDHAAIGWLMLMLLCNAILLTTSRSLTTKYRYRNRI